MWAYYIVFNSCHFSDEENSLELGSQTLGLSPMGDGSMVLGYIRLAYFIHIHDPTG